jgi:hypothetical protein
VRARAQVQSHRVQRSLFGNGGVDGLKTLSKLCEDSFWTGLTKLVARVSPEPTASSSSLAAGSASNKSISIPFIIFDGVIAESRHKCGFGRASQAGGERVDVMSGEHVLIYGMMHNYEIVKLKVEKSS